MAALQVGVGATLHSHLGSEPFGFGGVAPATLAALPPPALPSLSLQPVMLAHVISTSVIVSHQRQPSLAPPDSWDAHGSWYENCFEVIDIQCFQLPLLFHADRNSGLVLGTSLVSVKYHQSFAFDHPIHSSSFFLACAGICLLALNRFNPGLLSAASPVRDVHPLSLEPLPPPSPGRTSRPGRIVARLSGPKARTFVITFVPVTAAIIFRAELSRRIVADVQCARIGIESLLPLLLALYDAYKSHAGSDDVHSTWANVLTPSPGEVTSEPSQLILSALFVTIGSFLAAVSTSEPRSTYICDSSVVSVTRAIQYLALLLDAFIILSLNDRFLAKGTQSAKHTSPGLVRMGCIFLASAVVLDIGDVCLFVSSPRRRHWLDALYFAYLLGLFWPSMWVAATLLCAIRCLSFFRPLSLCIIIILSSTYLPVLTFVWSYREIFPPVPSVTICLSILFLCVGGAWHFALASVPGDAKMEHSRRIPPFRLGSSLSFAVVMALCLPFVFSELPRHYALPLHPIDELMADAKTVHHYWLNEASAGRTLALAVKEYRSRYRRDPPPGFDRWYEFASNRSSVIIDDFDSINHDLLPFWALQPSEIRARTWEITSNAWNEIAAISIRDGKAGLGPNTLPTHRWMLEGVVEMISPFAQWLPDMDIAMNLNDECRVALEWDKAEGMRAVGEQGGRREATRSAQWSSQRAIGWQAYAYKPNRDTRFEDFSFSNTFAPYGAITCPPGSSARNDRAWDTRRFCASCAEPQSLGPFLKDWALAADICHQPDLANLHGFFLSPAAFKTTHELMPVFSQSKVARYSDIIYPSAWNYVNKAAYDPSTVFPDIPFAQKDTTLFWRGATSEGVSVDGTWKGMTRQRLIHLANNLTSTDKIPIPLQDGDGTQLSYAYVDGSDLNRLLHLDIGTVDKIARCGGNDCEDQAFSLGIRNKSDFQEHWRHQYLFDVDGAGFSGRFIPFLQSHSLPFKTALFRAWYDSRLTPWLHFVPQDLRLQGVHATLAYFAGLTGRIAGREVGMPPHQQEAEFIAEQGRKWAAQVLRKEDMEIYFFRLLLEWGRLTDDRRDELGFAIEDVAV